MFLEIILEVPPCRRLSNSVSDREIVVLKDIIVLFSLRLSICKRHDEEIGFELLHRLPLSDN